MTKTEYNFPIRRPAMGDEGARDVIERGKGIIGRMSVGDLRKMGQFEKAILKQRKPKVKG